MGPCGVSAAGLQGEPKTSWEVAGAQALVVCSPTPHPGSSFHLDDSHVPSDSEASPSHQHLAFSEATLPLSGFLVPEASTFYFRGGSPGLGLHQGEQQRLEISPTSSQVLTIYLASSAHGGLRGLGGRSRSPESVERAGVDTEEESLAEVEPLPEDSGQECPGPVVPSFHPSRGRKQSLLCSRLHSQC